jgi:hypothetical protein
MQVTALGTEEIMVIQGCDEENEKFRIRARSHSVSGHGGMTILDTGVVLGQTLLVTNENSGQKTGCKVVSVRLVADGKHVLAFEFIAPTQTSGRPRSPSKEQTAAARGAGDGGSVIFAYTPPG